MLLCQCPSASALPTIPTVLCAESFGQIQKVAFQRLKKADGTKNFFDEGSTNHIEDLASWTPLLTAADGSKVVVSPYIEAPTSEGGAARTFGGGNETLGGVEVVVGREPTAFTGVMRNIPQGTAKLLKELQCEALSGNLGVFLFDEFGNIEGVADDPTAANKKVYPIPIRSLFIGDKTHGGLEAPDSNAIQWSFLPNYSDNLIIAAPTDFNPLTDLVVSAS